MTARATTSEPDRLERLREDWATDPTLKLMGFDTVEELAEHLRGVHTLLLGPSGGPFGYLYRQQLRRVRELQGELKREREFKASRR